MAEKSGLFNAVGGVPAYNDVDMATMFALLTGGQGYLVGKDNELEVTAGTGLQVLVGTGAAWIGEPNGWWYQNNTSKSFSLDAETAGYDRIDRIILRLDRNTTVLSVTAEVLKGTAAASSPVAPALTQNSTVYELSLAQVYVTGGSTSITVSDERESLCGKVYALNNAEEYPRTMYKSTPSDLNNNTTLESGMYTVQNGTDLGLATNWWHVINLKHHTETGYNAQIAIPLNSPTQPLRYRTSDAGVWAAWKTYAIEGNSVTFDDITCDDITADEITADQVKVEHTVTSTNGNTYNAYPVGVSYSNIYSGNNVQSGQTVNDNFPVYGTLLTVHQGSARFAQYLHVHNGSGVYFRSYYSGTWQPWRRLDSGKLDKTASFTLAVEHMNCFIKVNTSSNINITVPNHTSVPIPEDTDITIFMQGTGQVTLVPASNVVIWSEDSNLKSDGQFTAFTLRKVHADIGGYTYWAAIGRLTS